MSVDDNTGNTSDDMNYVKVEEPFLKSPTSSHEYESLEFNEISSGFPANKVTADKTIGSGEGETAGAEEVLACGGDSGEPRGASQDVTRVQDHEPIERLYYTLPRKTGLLRRLRRKPPKTVAEVGVQVDELDETPQQQLQQFMTGVSTQILQLHQLCAKQERLENLGQKISDLIELNKDISSNVSSSSSTDRIIVAYMEARDELDHMKSRLEESFQENDVLMKRLDEQEDELRSVTRERDDVRSELETSVSRTRDLELNSSTILEENDDFKGRLEQEKVTMNTMSENLDDALKKRDKYKKLFVKLKVNSSLIVDHYINELNMALYDNRQVLMNAIRGGPRDLKEVGRQIDNFLHIQQENNRLTDQVEYLSAQLTVSDILVDEITEQMDHMTQLLQEYKEAGVEPPTINAQHLQKQIDRYTVLMKNKEQYFAERKAMLREKLSKSGNTSEIITTTDPKQATNEEIANEPENNSDDKVQNETQKVETDVVDKIEEAVREMVVKDKDTEESTSPRVVTSHGDTPVMNNGTTDTAKASKKKKKKHLKLRRTNKVDNFVLYENKVETTQSMPSVVDFSGKSNVNNSNRSDKKSRDTKSQDARQYNYF